MFASRFSSSAHPLGPIALDSPAGGETDGLTDAERAAIAQVGASVGEGLRAGLGQRAAPAVEPAPRSSWWLVGIAAAAVAAIWAFRRKGA